MKEFVLQIIVSWFFICGGMLYEPNNIKRKVLLFVCAMLGGYAMELWHKHKCENKEATNNALTIR